MKSFIALFVVLFVVTPVYSLPVLINPSDIIAMKELLFGGAAFQNCSKLTSVTIPDSVTNIGTNVFQSCTSLTSVTISNNITTISNSVKNIIFSCIFKILLSYYKIKYIFHFNIIGFIKLMLIGKSFIR